MTIGDVYVLPYAGCTVELVRIIDKEGGKRLTETLYEWAENGDPKKTFKNKWEDVNLGIRFKNWIKK